jgi:hypothetical protein
MANVETPDIIATVAATRVADLHLGPVICDSPVKVTGLFDRGLPFRQTKSSGGLMQINGRLHDLVASSVDLFFAVSGADLMSAATLWRPRLNSAEDFVSSPPMSFFQLTIRDVVVPQPG